MFGAVGLYGSGSLVEGGFAFQIASNKAMAVGVGHTHALVGQACAFQAFWMPKAHSAHGASVQKDLEHRRLRS